MKITIENTEKDIRRVEIGIAGDHLTMTQVWEDLLRPALLAYGFHPTSVDSINKP